MGWPKPRSVRDRRQRRATAVIIVALGLLVGLVIVTIRVVEVIQGRAVL